MNRRIEFGELRIAEQAKEHIADCLHNNWVSIGSKTALFEEEWQKLFNYNSTVMVSSGTSADIAACMTLYEIGAKPGDYIICPALSFIATANAIRAAGFIPLFIDVKKDTLNIDETLVEYYLGNHLSKIAGIMAVNLMGKPCRLDALSDLSGKYRIPLIVDNCEAYGSQFNGKFSLSYADMETTSHYIAHIICCGEGGTVSANDPNVGDLIKSIRSHGRQQNSLYFDHLRYGLNLKPTDLHASIGLGEIEDFWQIFHRRKLNIYRFRHAVEGYEDKAYFVEEDDDCTNAPHGFSITLKEPFNTDENFQKITSILDKDNIHWKRNFGSMPHHKAFAYLGYNDNSMLNAQYIGKYGLHIGCHYWLSDEDVKYVCDSLIKCMKAIK